MRLNQLVECANCLEVDTPSKQGHCRTCNSSAVAWLTGQTLWRPPTAPDEPALSGIEREMLRDYLRELSFD